MQAFSSPLPIARYRFTAQVQSQALALPEYAGSLLRGPFGAALRQIACMTRQSECPGCPLLQTCPYSRIFETPAPPKGQHALQNFSDIPKPYVLEAPAPFSPNGQYLAAGSDFQFNLVLVGNAMDQLPLLIFAMQRMLAQGLTAQRVPCALQRVEHLGAGGVSQPVWSVENPVLADHQAALQAPTAPAGLQSLHLHLHSPMRLQSQGQPLRADQLTPVVLTAALARRCALLMEFHAGQNHWGAAAQAARHASVNLTQTHDLRWFDWTRYSGRQRQTMTLGGVMGRWSLHGSADTLAQVWPWLWLGQWLHVGKETIMGMGGYTLEVKAEVG